MKKLLIIVLLFGINLFILAVNQHGEIKSLKLKVAEKESLVQTLEQKANAASAAQLAISEQAQSCLDRESQRNAEGGIWLEILEQSISRDITDKEKANVPDDKTRNALLDALDKPL